VALAIGFNFKGCALNVFAVGCCHITAFFFFAISFSALILSHSTGILPLAMKGFSLRA
jgi:hypothetical protein